MDERVAAGARHLREGEQALKSRQLREGRHHFQSALAVFRPPELMMGEAHALRGLARVEMGLGDLENAEALVRRAVGLYQAVCRMVGDQDSESSVQHRDARHGEAAAMVVLGEVHSRRGNHDEARKTLSFARQVYQDEEHPAAAVGSVATARLAMREGQYDLAEESFQRALRVHEGSGDLGGQAEVLIGLAELARHSGQAARAEALYARARPMTIHAKRPVLEARAVFQVGGLMQQQLRLEEAHLMFEEALRLARQTQDEELEGFVLVELGDVRSRSGLDGTKTHLAAASRIFQRLDQGHGLGSVLLRLGQHAMRNDEIEVALIAVEAARRVWRTRDPVRGTGQALRVVVKALRPLEQWTVLLYAAFARASVAGHLQQNAIDVRDHFARRAPARLVEELSTLRRPELLARYQSMIEEVLAPLLARYGIASLDDEGPTAAAELIEALVAISPGTVSMPLDESDGHEALLLASPTEEAFVFEPADLLESDELP